MNVVEYITLQYTPDSYSSEGRRVALVFRRLNDLPERLHLKEVANWRLGMPEEVAEYIEDVLCAISTPDGAANQDAFERIGEMQAGVLRAEAQGTCQEDEVNRLVEQV